MPGVDQATQDAFWTAWLRSDLKKPGEKLFKVVDTNTGKAVAFTKVRYPAKLAEHAEEEHDTPPEGTDIPLLMHWFEQMDKYTDKHMNYEKDYCDYPFPPLPPPPRDPAIHWHSTVVHVLCTLPEYTRKGLGSMLLNRFLDDADKANAKTYIQATEEGAELYSRLGWKDIEEMTITTPKGPFVWRCMMREPNSGRYEQ